MASIMPRIASWRVGGGFCLLIHPSSEITSCHRASADREYSDADIFNAAGRAPKPMLFVGD
jgi:hypothetical protein